VGSEHFHILLVDECPTCLACLAEVKPIFNLEKALFMVIDTGQVYFPFIKVTLLLAYTEKPTKDGPA